MKNASAASLAILSGGLYIRADLYDLTLTDGLAYHFTASDLPLSSVVYPSVTSHTYLTGLSITRGSMTQAVGLDAQEMELTIAPQPDAPTGAPTIAGYSIIQAARLGLLDNATILYSKLFMNYPTIPGQPDTSPGAVAWFQGLVADMDIGRFAVQMKMSSNLLVLNQVQMPRNLYQGACVHTVYDTGCTLLKATFTVTGTIGTVANNAVFNTSLTQADDYFDLGVITFTSGINNGFSATVKKFLHTSGAMSLCVPMPGVVTAGDTFSIYPGCDHLPATCTTKFSNLIHFKGMPYVPVPETLYDGGTSNPPGATPGAKQRGSAIGSSVAGGLIPPGR